MQFQHCFAEFLIETKKNKQFIDFDCISYGKYYT